LPEAFDTIFGECGAFILADPAHPQTPLLRVHGERDFRQPFFVLAEHLGNAGDGEDVGDRSHRQAARLTGSTTRRQFHGRSSSSLLAGCPAMRASTSASQVCGSMSFIFAVTIRLYMAAARWPPRSEPVKSHDLRPRAIPPSARSA